MLQDYLVSAAIGVVGGVAITLIWSRFKGLPTILAWAICALLGVAAWGVFTHLGGALEVMLSLVLAGVFIAVIDWHRKMIPK